MGRFCIAVTGASGGIYAVRLLTELASRGHEIHLILSEAGSQVLMHETGLDPETLIDRIRDTAPLSGGNLTDMPEDTGEAASVAAGGSAAGRVRSGGTGGTGGGDGGSSPAEGSAAVRVHLHDAGDLFSPLSSGSFRLDGMAVVPCSMSTLGRIAAGSGEGLIHRAADVCLKERRRIVLVPRETPLSRIHLTNMLALAEQGADILPAMPGFYHHPEEIDDLVRFIVARILDRLGVENALIDEWGS